MEQEKPLHSIEVEATLYRYYRRGKISAFDRFAILRGEITLKEAIERMEKYGTRYYQ